MSNRGSADPAARRAGSGIARLARAWRALPANRQLAAAAALGLCLTLFLPWYQETGFEGGKSLRTASASLTGWHAFSWVEAAVLLVAISVLMLLFLRAEGRAFHLPGGDGFIIMAAGGWTCVLVIWRILDKQGATSANQVAITFGIKWGIFTALAVAALLTYAGARIRADHLPEPLLPGEEPSGGGSGDRGRDARAASRRTRRTAPAGGASAGARTATAGAADARSARRDQVARRASWAEPVSWEDPAAISKPAIPEQGPAQLRIPTGDEPPH